MAFLERLLERVALRVRVRVAVLLRVRLLVGTLEAVPPAARFEAVAVPVGGAREAALLADRERVAGAVACTEELAEAGREAEPEGSGVRLTDREAEAEEEEEPEEVLELELLDVPVWVEAVVVVGVDAAVPAGVKAAVPDCVEPAELVCEAELLVVPVAEVLRAADGLAVEDKDELPLGVRMALALAEGVELGAAVCEKLGVPCVELSVPDREGVPV